MDENEAAEGDGFGDRVGVPMEEFHRNETISAVADDGFLVEEEDDDYEDLYNDVNVGENFLQSVRKNEDLGFKEEAEHVAPPPESSRSALPVAVEEVKVEKEETVVSRGSGGADGYRDLGFRGNELGGRDPVKVESCDPIKVEPCVPSDKIADLEQNAGDNVVNRGVIQRPNAAGAGVIGNAGNVGNSGNDNLVRHGMVNGNSTGNNVGGVGVLGGGSSGGGGGGGGTVLFVGDLHWWTTDAELEAELSKYGTVKEVKFFDEKASGKSKGYCQAEFHEPAAATACKEGMNGHVFNGRACVVAFASPFTVKRMGEAQMNRNQQTAQAAPLNSQARRGPGDTAVKTGLNNNNATGGNFQGGGDNNRNFGRGNWGRGGPQGMGNRGPVGPMRNRPGGGVVGRGFMGNGGSGFGQGMGAGPPMMHPQTMMGQGFDPAFGGPMGRMGGYGGFPGAPNPPFSGMLPSFPPVGGGVGLPGVAPHLNPAFFGRGMPMNGMGMMPRAGMEGPNMGMWSEPNMGGGWAGEEHGYRAGESSFGEEAVSDHQYGEESRDRGAWPSNKEKDRGSERDWSGSSDRRHRDDREPSYERDKARDKNTGHEPDWQEERRRQDDRDVGRERVRESDRDHSRKRSRDRDRGLEKDRGSDRERDRHRDDRDRYADNHRYKDREQEYDDEWDRGRSSRTHTKSRLSHEDDSRSRSRDVDYEKRRRLTSD
ncbi:PREDICTED: cleavage and polyadenylation specificity factor subunit 6-like isoform X2 [Nicotiana attenuata]|uniref:cleavage and polyadenylation specificity factor subunit 6-like isoform X2 n=1 Tax=Nicotiana attenuata TaxID=49451 RepID=UPI000905619E|nr:PREDICTED: cleavage and polyadenylation specificity factor subunit 6-like isoform X2 [Nicotiana attenuata]